MNSILGTILDPAADKILMTTLTVTLAVQDFLPSMLWYHTSMVFLIFSHSSPCGYHHWTRCSVEPVGILHSLHLVAPSSTFWLISHSVLLQNNPQKTFARYWDFSIPSAEVHPTFISKVCSKLTSVSNGSNHWGTGQHCIAATSYGNHYSPSHPTVWLWSCAPRFTVRQLTLLSSCCLHLNHRLMVATTTIWSGLSYIFSKNVVRILSKRDRLKS